MVEQSVPAKSGASPTCMIAKGFAEVQEVVSSGRAQHDYSVALKTCTCGGRIFQCDSCTHPLLCRNPLLFVAVWRPTPLLTLCHVVRQFLCGTFNSYSMLHLKASASMIGTPHRHGLFHESPCYFLLHEFPRYILCISAALKRVPQNQASSMKAGLKPITGRKQPEAALPFPNLRRGREISWVTTITSQRPLVSDVCFSARSQFSAGDFCRDRRSLNVRWRSASPEA